MHTVYLLATTRARVRIGRTYAIARESSYLRSRNNTPRDTNTRKIFFEMDCFINWAIYYEISRGFYVDDRFVKKNVVIRYNIREREKEGRREL